MMAVMETRESGVILPTRSHTLGQGVALLSVDGLLKLCCDATAMGWLTNIFGGVALVVLWPKNPDSWLWWTVVGLIVADVVFSSTRKESARRRGAKAGATLFLGVVGTVVQLLIIGIGVGSFFR
jgi:hypothetical protein